MGVLRSEPMKHGTLVLPVDRARFFVDLVGLHTRMQFEDMNDRDMHRPYKKRIQRIDEVERMLRFVLEEVKQIPGATVVDKRVDNFLENADDYNFEELEAKVKAYYNHFSQFKENSAQLTQSRNAALEARFVVQTAMASLALISSQAIGAGLNPEEAELGELAASSQHLLDDQLGMMTGSQEISGGTIFNATAGVIPQAEQDRFARSIFRATRGNAFTHFQQIPEPLVDPKLGKAIQKSVFVIHFADLRVGSSASAMSERIKRICCSYGVNTYPWPNSRDAAEQMMNALRGQIGDQERLLPAHRAFVEAEAATLLEPARPHGNSLIEEWRLFCRKEKAIYATLNLFEGSANLRANCWFPEKQESQIRALLVQHSAKHGGHHNASAMLVADRTSTKKGAPTYIHRNEFTWIFQELVDTYGLPRYREANPMLFTTVSFPFLFGIMYGDVGHGSLLLALGLWAVYNQERIRHSFPTLYVGRYILTMMGFFAMYCGLLYNDFFSVGLPLFESRWSGTEGDETVTFEPAYDVKNQGGPGPYPFGVDPAWRGAQNELIFMNSLKMKISVVFGVTQMLIGILLRFSNAIYERNFTDLVCECCPMLVFMLCFFGFMDYMVLHKWVNSMRNPPSIINSLIAMAMWGDDPDAMFGEALPRRLMMLTLLTVPWMLIPKPTLKYLQVKAHERRRSARTPNLAGAQALGNLRQSARHVRLEDEAELGFEDVDVESVALRPADDHDDEHTDIGEMVIHQIIETIEYVLGTVSHTASYLRLWALSLAHQQLSFVFFDMFIASAMAISFPLNVFALFINFAIWFVVTLCVLLGMDVLECFLHTLRLHWVEFQSKFYRADGLAFVPYRHKTILEDEER
eukprot:TRINITY_DN8739_c0_g1_i1.p1 TRINITY_DN8739_c0_g1~~TRINITY_DN8739_c0_g1_i1.p1  ORF type:complete len:861 (+),score=185.39 TRINITY_DN8739_c0_g1_i1:123-2705(+)